jgi:hypothetical protein
MEGQTKWKDFFLKKNSQQHLGTGKLGLSFGEGER